MVENHCTGNPCPVKTSNQPPLADGQACALLAKAIDTTELAQAGFNEPGRYARRSAAPAINTPTPITWPGSGYTWPTTGSTHSTGNLKRSRP